MVELKISLMRSVSSGATRPSELNAPSTSAANACRAGWELYLRTRLKQKLLGWAASRGQKAELGDPALEGKITLHSDTPGPALRWFGDPEVRGLVTRWLLEEDAIFLALRDSNDLKERALVVHYAYMVPVRTEENVRILLDRLDWLAGRVEAG